MKHIITIQHTQSVHHTNGMVGSWTDWDLTELGKKQADNIGRKLKKEFEGKKVVIYSSDLKRANNVARNMVAKYGMSESIGNLVFDDGGEVFIGKDYGHTRNYSEETAATIDKEVKIIIDNAYEKVKTVLKDNIDKGEL